MEKIKYCPKCMKVHPLDAKECDCGYVFKMKEEDEVDTTVATTNTKVIVDNKPTSLWSTGAFFTLSIMGWVWYKKFKDDYPIRAQAAKKGAISFYVFVGVVILILLFLAYLKANGLIA